MRFLSAVILLTVFFGTSAFGLISAPDLARFRNTNILGPYNPGAENGTQFWTASAGTFTTTTTAANVGDGTRSFSWATGASGRTIKSNLTAIPAGLYGRNGTMSVMLETAATDFVLSLSDGSSPVGSSLTVTGLGASQYGLYRVPFVFPTSGSIQLVLTSASSQTVYVDQAYIGSTYPYDPSTYSLGTCTTAKTIDWSLATNFTVTLTNSDACAFTYSNAASGQVITLDLTQGPSGGGSATASWATTTKWVNGTAPTITTGNSATDTCTIKYNGSDYRGNCVQNLQ